MGESYVKVSPWREKGKNVRAAVESAVRPVDCCSRKQGFLKACFSLNRQKIGFDTVTRSWALPLYGMRCGRKQQQNQPGNAERQLSTVLARASFVQRGAGIILLPVAIPHPLVGRSPRRQTNQPPLILLASHAGTAVLLLRNPFAQAPPSPVIPPWQSAIA